MTIVQLNVGGQLFITTQSTLENFPSMLGALVRNNNPATLVNGAYFIDRDPHVFRWILNYLRGSKILPQKYTIEMYQLMEEASYFAIDGLASRIQHMITPIFAKGDHVSVRSTKFTVLEIEDTGYLATRSGTKYRLDSSEHFAATVIEKGDVITAFRQGYHKWQPGVCIDRNGNNCIVQFDNEQAHTNFKVSGVRF